MRERPPCLSSGQNNRQHLERVQAASGHPLGHLVDTRPPEALSSLRTSPSSSVHLASCLSFQKTFHFSSKIFIDFLDLNGNFLCGSLPLESLTKLAKLAGVFHTNYPCDVPSNESLFLHCITELCCVMHLLNTVTFLTMA